MFQRHLEFDYVIYINKESNTIFHQFLFQILYTLLKVGCQLLSRARNYDKKYKHRLF